MKRGQISITVVLLILGIMIAVQVRSTREAEQNNPSSRVQELTVRLKETQEERNTLFTQVKDMRDKLDSADLGQAVRDELNQVRIEAGRVPVSGPGIEVMLDDSPKTLQPGEDPNLYILHEEDLLKVINEIRAGGAEAISINGQRLLATSEIRCAGNTILVNTRKIVPPIVILATGDPDTMQSGLEIKGGIFEQLKFWGLVAVVRKKDDLKIPAYASPVTFKFSKPLEQ